MNPKILGKIYFLHLVILVKLDKFKCQKKHLIKTASFAVTISKLAVIFYLGFVEVFKIGKLIREKLGAYFDELRLSREWAEEAYAIQKKRLEEQKVMGVLEN